MENNEKNELKKEDLKREHGFFGWHLYPEDPIELKSVVEILCFSLIVSVCAYLYYRWNIVPNKEIELVVEDFSDIRTVVGKDSVTRLFTCNARFTLPMTRHQEFVEDTSRVVYVQLLPFYSNGQHSDLINYSFVDDSIRNGLRLIIDRRKEDSLKNVLFEKYKIPFAYSVRGDRNSCNDSIKNSVCVNHETDCHTYMSYSVSLPFFHTDDFVKRDTDSIYIETWGVKNGKEYREAHLFARNDSLFSPSVQRSEGKLRHHWSNWFNIYRWFYGFNDALHTPRWGRLEDISQAYVSLKLKSNTIDSIHICIDFVGATEFSKVNPAPDEVDMSSITYTDPVKIYKIRDRGLRFHAKFVELQNLQQIRVFTVTAIMSAFVLVFVIFLISAYFKLRRQYSGRKNMALTIGQILKIILVGVPLYCLIYWTIIYFVLQDVSGTIDIPLLWKMSKESLISNCITIPLVILILMLSDTKLRKYIRPFIVVSAYLTFLSLMGYAIYKHYSADIKTLLDKGFYRRATQMMYDKVMDSDSLSNYDYNLLRAILSENPLADSTVVHNIDYFTIEDGKVLLRQKDTISVYDIRTKKMRRMVHPNSVNNPEVMGQYIFFNCYDSYNHYYYCDVARISNSDKLVRFKGKFLGTTDLGGSIVTYIIPSLVSDSPILYYMYPETKAYKKVIMEKCRGVVRTYLHNTLICEQEDSLLFYEIDGTHIKKTQTYKGDFAWVLNAKDGIVMTRCYGWPVIHYIGSNEKNDRDTLQIDKLVYVYNNVWNKALIQQLRDTLRRLQSDEYIYIVSISDSKIYIQSRHWGDWGRNRVDVYNIEDTIKKVKSIVYDKDVVCSEGGYVAYHSDGKFYVESIDDVNEVRQLGESSGYSSFGLNLGNSRMINGYLYYYRDDSLRIVNLESDSILIARNKYLSNREKRKLAEKLRKMKKK